MIFVLSYLLCILLLVCLAAVFRPEIVSERLANRWLKGPHRKR